MIATHTPKLGQLRVRQWESLHLKQAPDQPFVLILIERLDEPNSKPLWLIWLGQDMPILDQIWQKYLRRFAIEHWYRFVRLHWTTPQLSTPKQMETWSDLMPLITWQLWLARHVVEDAPLPWQKPMTKLTPGRIANSFAALLVRIASPASHPKPRGKSLGCPLGKIRSKRPYCLTVKKGFSKKKKVPEDIAS